MQREDIADHYTRAGLLAAIEDGVATLGKTPASVSVEDLAPVDEFHVGGREASEAFLDQLGLTPSERVLDIGCGLGKYVQKFQERGAEAYGLERALCRDSLWLSRDGDRPDPRVRLHRADAVRLGGPGRSRLAAAGQCADDAVRS